MSSRGKVENDRLKENLQEQLDRLVSQLSDLEEAKDDLSEEEYNEMKEETLDQLKEIQMSLVKMVKGDITLVDDLNSIQLAIQAAISNAFQTPEIIRLFAKKQPDGLRQRLAEISRDAKIGRLTSEAHQQQKAEILSALRKLGEELKSDELAFLESHSNVNMKQFEKVSEDLRISQEKMSQLAAANK